MTIMRSIVLTAAVTMLSVLPVAAADWWIYVETNIAHGNICDYLELEPAGDGFQCRVLHYDTDGDGAVDPVVLARIYGPVVVAAAEDASLGCTAQFDGIVEGAYYLYSDSEAWRVCVPPPVELYLRARPVTPVSQSATFIVRRSSHIFSDGFESGDTRSWH